MKTSPSSPFFLPPEAGQILCQETSDLIAVARPDASVLFLNGRGKEATGQRPSPSSLSEMQPEWAWQIVASEGLPYALQHGSWTGETAALGADGTEFPVRQTLLTFGQEDDRRIVSLMHDLSVAKHLKVELMETTNRYETAIRLSGHVLLDWEPYTGRLTCSGDLLGLLGCEPEELAAGIDPFRALIHPGDLANFDREINRTATTHDSLAVAFRVRQHDGDFRAVRAAGGFYLDREGRFGRVTALLSDAELLRSTQEEVNQLKAQLELSAEEQVRAARLETEQARQARSEFLSRMSHELRTPLNAILGFTQLLELEDPSPAQRESIDHITRAGNHLLSLVNEVLDLSRVESGKLTLNVEPVPLYACLQDLLELIRPSAERAEISLRTEFKTPVDWCVNADPQRLRQVMVNLLSNAVKFNHHGGSVTVQTERSTDERVRISITDTGPGIPPEKLHRLFIPLEKYRRTAHHGSDIGLGLALSRGVMQAMRGDLGVDSHEGFGSTFWVELPIVREEEPNATEHFQEEAVRPLRDLHQTTLLYVEDEELNLQLVRRVMSDYPEFKLVTTTQGRHALKMAREHHPKLVLLDLNLPDISGEQVLHELKGDPEFKDLPVIMVTADIIESRLERMINAGATGYLTKPFKIADLIRIIRDTLATEGGHQ